jgi:hypothetical protein
MWFNVVGKTITFHDLSVVAGQKSLYRFVFRTQPQTEYDVPIISFSANANARAFLPPAAIQTMMTSQNPETKQPITIFASPPADPNVKSIGKTNGKQSAVAGGGLGALSPVAVGRLMLTALPPFKGSETGVHVPVPSSQIKASQRLESMRTEARFYANDSATLTAPGVPNLMGTTIVTVDEGVGIPFSGPYLVTDVTHTLSTGGYEMRLNLKRSTGTIANGTVPLNQPSPATGTTGSQSAGPLTPDGKPEGSN